MNNLQGDPPVVACGLVLHISEKLSSVWSLPSLPPAKTSLSFARISCLNVQNPLSACPLERGDKKNI